MFKGMCIMKIEPLLSSYQPKKILHREEQIEKIESTFKLFEDFGSGDNLIIKGISGGGKTCVIKNLIQKLNNDNHLYFSADGIKNSKELWKKLIGEKKYSAKSYSDVLENIVNNLTKKRKILVIDEINRLKNLTEFFDDLNFIFRRTSIPIILITNKADFSSNMEEDVKKTLFFREVIFPAYNSEQIKDILNDRLSLISDDFKKNFADEIKNYICALASKESSIRNCLDLSRSCIINQKFTRKYVDSVVQEIYHMEWESFYNGLSSLEKRFLRYIYDLYSKGTKKISTKDINSYFDLDVTPSRISQIVTTFEHDYAIIETKKRNLGKKGGSFREILVNHNMFLKLQSFA